MIEKRKKRKFLRRGTRRLIRLGRKSKKLQKWRRERGRDSKIRENRAGKRVKVKIGFKNKKDERGKINGKALIYVENLKQAEKINEGDLIIIKRIGLKKRKEIEHKIKEKKGKILNLKEKKNES